jgi:hypothetical protein
MQFDRIVSRGLFIDVFGPDFHVPRDVAAAFARGKSGPPGDSP